MAIAKLGMTGGSYGAIFYVMREKEALVIGGTFCGNKRDILAQSAAWNRTRPDVESNMIHLIESYPVDEEVSDETMLLRAEEKLKRLGLKDCPFLLVKHTDKSHAHAHHLVSRIRSDGSIIDDSNIALRSIAVTKELDAEFGMRETPFYFRAERIGRKEYEMMKQMGEDSRNKILRQIIETAAQGSEKSFEKFLTNLEQEKVGFRLYLNERQTNVKGIAFDCQKTGHTRGVSGSKLGEGFKFPALAKQIGYRKEKDFPKLIDKYQLKLKSEIQPKTKKPERADQKETYVLVSRAVNGVTVQDEDPAKVSDENQRENFNKSTRVETIEKLKIHPKPHATKLDVPAEDFQPPDDSPDSITGGENQIPIIEKNEHRQFTEPLNSDGVLLRGREARLFYKNDAERDGGASAEDDFQAKTRFIKSLQNKIDEAQKSAESFSGFLQNLQNKKIICLPEIDDDRRVFDFVFIKKGIAVSSGELGEDYKFQALARKLDYPDKPIFVEQQADPNSFQAQAAALRYKPISDYWWKIKAETDGKGQVTISPAAFEFLRVAYKGTFETDVENFEDSFNETGTADQFLQKLDNMQKHVGIYTESIALLNKKLAEGRQTHRDGSLIIVANLKDEPQQTARASLPSVTPETNLIEQKQPDETFGEFQAIFKQANLEKLLESKSGTAELETVGNSPARYQIVFSNDEIKFTEVKNADNKIDPAVENRNITFKRDEAGDYKPAASFVLPDDLYYKAAARHIKKDVLEKIDLLKTSEFGENIIVTSLDIENDSRAKIEETNRANLEKYLSRQLGKELVAEIEARTARYDETAFRDNVNDERLKVTADIGRGEETREISRADLLRERESIAQSNVYNVREQGSLDGMVEDEGISIEAAEKRQYRKETLIVQAMQKPWNDALDKAIAGETARLEEVTAQANQQLKTEKIETSRTVKQVRIEDTRKILPTLTAEKIWLEQIKAVKRFDTDTFVKLEELHQASNLPRPNDVYACLRGMETIVKMNVRRENAALLERFGKEAAEQNIVVNLRRESGELKLEAWRLQKTEQPPKQPAKEIQGDSAKIKAGQTSSSIKTPRPLTDKINSSLSAKTDLSWISDNKKTLNPYLNPVSVIKNDEGLQIVRAVADYIDQKNKNEQLADLTEKTVNAIQTLKSDCTSEFADPEVADNLARLSQAVETAVQREEAMRENLRLDDLLNIELLKTPERPLIDAEMKQVGAIASETGDVQEVKEYYDLVSNDVEFADAVGETEEHRAAVFFLAEARAVGQSNNAIEQITPLNDGSINVELNPAMLTQAIDSFKTADAFEEFQPANVQQSIIKNLSLEQINQAEQFLAANNQLRDSMNNQVFTVGNDLMKTLQPPLNQSELEALKNPVFAQDFNSRFEQINRSDQFVDEMARQAEIAAQNQIPFEQTARNSIFVNLSDQAEAKEMRVWENDRQQREAQIARENAQKRSVMTDGEKAEQDAVALDEAVKDEFAQDQGREDSVQTL